MEPGFSRRPGRVRDLGDPDHPDGKVEGLPVSGSIPLIGGLGLAGTLDHTTELWHAGVFTAVLGLGLGMLMQNLVLAETMPQPKCS